jgi:phage shock protein PspC (stress-responsive transcriptional regulator)
MRRQKRTYLGLASCGMAECFESLFQIVKVIYFVLHFYQHVINVYFYISLDLIVKHLVHQPLIGCPCIFQPEGHDFIAEESSAGDEGRLL